MTFERIFGGNPLGVIIRLIILSVIVGIVMSALGIRIDNIFYHLRILGQRLYDMGFDIFAWGFGYFLLGAVIVIPVWFVARLFGAFGGSKKKSDGA